MLDGGDVGLNGHIPGPPALGCGDLLRCGPAGALLSQPAAFPGFAAMRASAAARFGALLGRAQEIRAQDGRGTAIGVSE